LIGTAVEVMWDRDLAELQIALSKAWATEEVDEAEARKATDTARVNSDKKRRMGAAHAGGKGKGSRGAVAPRAAPDDGFCAPTPIKAQERRSWVKFNQPPATVNLVDRPKVVYVPPVQKKLAIPQKRDINLDEDDVSREADVEEVEKVEKDEDVKEEPDKKRRIVKRGKKKMEGTEDTNPKIAAVPSPAPEPPQKESSLTFLQRVLSRQNARTASINLPASTSSTTSHTALGGNEDPFGFGFGSSVDLSKPFTVDLDDECLLIPPKPSTTTSAPPERGLPSGSMVEIPDTQPEPRQRAAEFRAPEPPIRPARGRKRTRVIDDDE